MSEVQIVPNGGERGTGWDPPLGRWTFQYKPALNIVLNHASGRILNACAGQTELPLDDVVRNDINPECGADLHVDVAEISDHFEPMSFDTVVFDPPFDQSQADDKYDGMHATEIHSAFECFNELVSPAGTVITFGWNSWGMSTYPAFERQKTYLLQRGATLQDVIVSVDKRTSATLT